MDNEFGYIDNKPFKEVDINKQKIAVISTFDKKIEFKVNDIEKYFIWDKENYIPEVYAVDSKGNPITALRVITTNNSFGVIPSSKLLSDMFFLQNRSNNDKIRHFTRNTKISKLEYFHDDIKTIFGNESLKYTSKMKSDRLQELSIKGKNLSNKKIGGVELENNTATIYLASNFEYNHNYIDTEKMIIKDSSSLIFTFKKSIDLEIAYTIVRLIDSTIHLLILNKKRHRKLYISDYCQNKYLMTDPKKYIEENKKSLRSFLICKKDTCFVNFIKIFKSLYNLEKNSKNALFPILEFDREKSTLEISFLEYYKTMEYLDLQRQKSKGKNKDKTFLVKYLTLHEDFRKSIFNNQPVKEIEEEIRALRNYYSHEGYYIDNLPIPTDNPKRYKTVEVKWLYDVLRFIKTLTYVELYKYCGINIKWHDIMYNL